ncbi:MAG: hypothetical protein NUV70_08630, partial [Caldiserica bacterium]|nr:hypothetical protein [Caldisericota bacterium]
NFHFSTSLAMPQGNASHFPGDPIPGADSFAEARLPLEALTEPQSRGGIAGPWKNAQAFFQGA